MLKFTGYQWLLINLATHYGKKGTYATKIKWALVAIKDDLLVKTAKDQAQYYACLCAIKDTHAGKPTGYLCERDASASGPSLLSVVTRCKTGMLSTGVINTDGQAPDLYSKFTTTKISREMAKDAVMPSFYGSKALPELIFGDDVDAFFEKAASLLPGAVAAKDLMINAWDHTATAHTWTLPNGYIVHKANKIAYETVVTSRFMDESLDLIYKTDGTKDYSRELAAHITHSIDGLVVQEMQARCNYSINDVLRARSRLRMMFYRRPAITDRSKFISIDSIYNMEELNHNQLSQLHELIEHVLDNRSFELVTIHDGFKALANNMDRVGTVYNRIMHDLYYSTTLTDILTQLTGITYGLPAADPEVAAMILESDYALN